MGLIPDFWRDRSVLVTGHTGFKGAWLSLWLQSLGARVSGYALPPVTPCIFDLASVESGMTSHLGDLRDQAQLDACIKRESPDVIFHLAAQSLVRPSYTAPAETWAINVMGTLNLLESVRAFGSHPKVIVVTSDKCYENREQARPYHEEDTLGGIDPYSSSKAATEILVASWRRSFPGAFSLATARAGNVFGGGDWATDRLFPDLIKGFSVGREVHLRYPHAVRPWQHVLEPLLGYLLLAQALDQEPEKYACGWNFGPSPGDNVSVEALARKAAHYWGHEGRFCIDLTTQPHEASTLILDSRKAMTELGWQPRWNTDQAIEASVNWYRRQLYGTEMATFSRLQIQQYLNGETPHAQANS